MAEIIEKTRPQQENEFFFQVHTNIGSSDEFKRLIEYINKRSNIRIEKVTYQSIDQMNNSSVHSGGAFNFKIVHHKDKEEEEPFEEIAF